MTRTSQWIPSQFVVAGDIAIAMDQIAFVQLNRRNDEVTLAVRLKGEAPIATPRVYWSGKDAETAWEQIERPLICVGQVPPP